MRRIKFTLLLGIIGVYYLIVTLLALSLGLIAEIAGRDTARPYLTASGLAFGLITIWAALVTVIA